jgi:hypothetical protein
MPETVLPQIPLVPAGTYAAVCNALKEILEVRLGRRGDPLDEGLTRRDLTEDAAVMAWITALTASLALDVPETCIISGGVAHATGNSHNLIVDTEDGDSVDELDKIEGFSERDIVTVRSANSSRVVLVKRGDYFKMPADFYLNSIFDRIEFDCLGSGIMVQRWRSNNA